MNLIFRATKVLHICAGHQLDLPYPSKCTNQHGHNYRVAVTVAACDLNDHGMVVDFTLISDIVKRLDHDMVENHLDNNGTAENIADWIWGELEKAMSDPKELRGNTSAYVQSVEIGETDGNRILAERC